MHEMPFAMLYIVVWFVSQRGIQLAVQKVLLYKSCVHFKNRRIEVRQKCVPQTGSQSFVIRAKNREALNR